MNFITPLEGCFSEEPFTRTHPEEVSRQKTFVQVLALFWVAQTAFRLTVLASCNDPLSKVCASLPAILRQAQDERTIERPWDKTHKLSLSSDYVSLIVQ